MCCAALVRRPLADSGRKDPTKGLGDGVPGSCGPLAQRWPCTGLKSGLLDEIGKECRRPGVASLRLDVRNAVDTGELSVCFGLRKSAIAARSFGESDALIELALGDGSLTVVAARGVAGPQPFFEFKDVFIQAVVVV